MDNPLSRFSRRALAPISITLIDPASSIHSGADEIVPSDSVMRRQSSRFRWPVRNLCASICATDATSRCSSDSLDISRLNMATGWPPRMRSEEHTSELQSQSNLVCRLLLEKKNNTRYAVQCVQAGHPSFSPSSPVRERGSGANSFAPSYSRVARCLHAFGTAAHVEPSPQAA